jgi:hypothetical protein
MARLRRIAMAGLAAIAIGGVTNSGSAMETRTFQNRLAGATIGLPLGALPPPGLYAGLSTAYLGMLSGSGTNGASTGNECAPAIKSGSCRMLPTIAQAVPLLWVPGWTIFGANYSASVVEAFYVFVACGGGTGTGNAGGGCGGSSPIASGGFVYTNTFFQPINLSWNLGGGWFVATAFSFTAPDGTRLSGTPNPDYWTFEPSIAISYLSNNWVASWNNFYDINTKSQGICCASNSTITSGNAIYGDLTALYKFGKWSIGPVGYYEIQTTADTGTCTGSPGVKRCGSFQIAGAGALVGYDFGPIDLQVWMTDSFLGHDTGQGAGGLNVWSRIGFKIWGPDAPRPLVSKN